MVLEEGLAQRRDLNGAMVAGWESGAWEGVREEAWERGGWKGAMETG